MKMVKLLNVERKKIMKDGFKQHNPARLWPNYNYMGLKLQSKVIAA